MSHSEKLSPYDVAGEVSTVGLRDIVKPHGLLDVRPQAERSSRPETGLEPDIQLIALDDSAESARVTSNGAGAKLPDQGDGIASLIRRANHDELTGLANRNWFLTAVEQDRRSSPKTSGALFLIDLDGFKAINDTWGHGAGDAVLAEVGSRLSQVANDCELAARFGGDEFAFWAPDRTQTEALMLAERIVTTLTEPIPGELGLSVGASAGWVMSSDSSPVLALLSRADIALYAVKERGGRGHQMFDRALAAERVEGRVLQREIRQAMHRGQFKAIRQSISTMEGAIVGHEMLARWNHPRRGILHPAAFLPAVLASGKGAEFDVCMMDLIFSEIETDRSDGVPTLPSWINLTEYSITEATVEYLAAKIDSGLVAANELVIEVSEDARTESSESVRVLEAIADLGIGIAIDDFGAGYSRLGAIIRLPVSFVKIDRQFVHGVSGDGIGILRAMIQLIEALGAKSVAEGVETEEDRAMLAEIGCDYMQGFLSHCPELDQRQSTGHGLEIL